MRIDDDPILDPEEAWRVTEEAVARNDAHNGGLAAEFDGFVLLTARRYREFTADDVWDTRGAVPKLKSEASALGPAMRRAVKAGVMEPTGEFWLSRRPTAHRKPLPVYRSLKTQRKVRRVESLDG